MKHRRWQRSWPCSTEYWIHGEKENRCDKMKKGFVLLGNFTEIEARIIESILEEMDIP
ncbi:MAG: hypothetical protein GX175_02975, partial [Halanaerobiaceae bacterium]|nr:hypothetical protein [Halanaerobiaceae bacterium]